MKAIILAAGIGSRFGRTHPKTLTKLLTGESILERQIRFILDFIPRDNIIIVIGYKKALIMKEYPDLLYVYNNNYKRTNTAKSLLCALNNINDDDDIIWLNGDVVFDNNVIKSVVDFDGACIAVNTKPVDSEEVKYTLNEDGTIKQISKIIKDGLGEAVGINKIMGTQLNLYKKTLDQCEEQDYFERGLEISIEKGMKIFPVDITQYFCIEVDNQGDLEKVNSVINNIL